MDNRRALTEIVCAVYFKYPDNSTIRCLCTSNRDIVTCYGILWKPGILYDIEVSKPIPAYMFELDTTIYELSEDTFEMEALDTFAQGFVKNTWEY